MKQKKFEEANEIMKTSAKDLIKFLETRYPDFEFNYTDTDGNTIITGTFTDWICT